MNEIVYKVIYDVTKTSILFEVLSLVAWFLLVVFGGIILWSKYSDSDNVQNSNGKALVAGLFMISSVLFVIGLVNTASLRSQCIDWVRKGDYSVVTGRISEFHPMRLEERKQESFTVNDVHFQYPIFQNSGCGFYKTINQSGLIKDGLPVRISYRHDRILILEVGE